MAKFEIEIPDVTAALMKMNRADGSPGRWEQRLLELGKRTLTLIKEFETHKNAREWRDPPVEISDNDLADVALFFQSLGRWVQEFSGVYGQLVSVEEKARRAERSKRSHETRRQQRDAGIPSPKELRAAALLREEEEDKARRIAVATSGNVVKMFAPRPPTPPLELPDAS